ncbi:MAG: AMP-binding protein [Sandaracinaceae bacterium]|nr:AMP-binding protein [Sandaracinaceae bacterium]
MTTTTTRIEARRWLGRARAAARVALRSGILDAPSAKAVAVLLKQRAGGPLGVPALFRVHAAARGDHPAVIDRDGAVTYAEIDERIDRLATGLRARLGLGAGDAAVIVLPNCREMIEAQAALARLGAASVAVSWRSTAPELEYIAEHSGARAVIVGASVIGAVADARPRLTGVPERNYVVVGGEAPFGHAYDALVEQSPPERRDGREGSVVIYTSGTTGKPKGAVRTFPEDVVWAILHVLDELPIRADDRHLAVCPMYHSTAFGFISFTLVLGGTVVIEPFDPEGFLAAIERHRITTTAVVPTMLHRVLELPAEVRARYDTRSLHAVFSGGAPLSGTLARHTIEELGHVLYNFYGATETGLNTLATPDELLRAPGTIGHAIAENEIRILDDAGLALPDGETGELWVKNGMLVAGYHADAAATSASMREGFFSVGDLAHRDADGLYHLDGRKRDMIISGGVNVYPREVEEVLHAHPQVAEVAVVGVEDPEWGERVRACVVPRDPAIDPAELIRWARERLAGPKVPREVRLLDALPKNPTGKVLKRELRGLP